MVQKTPYAFRLGYNQDWNNTFFPKSKKDLISWIEKDELIRNYFYSVFPDIDLLKIRYAQNKIVIYLYVSGINLVLGVNNENSDKILKSVYSLIKNDKVIVEINLIEIRKIYSHAQLVANLISRQLKEKFSSRWISKNMLLNVKKENEVKGVKIILQGCLDGSKLSRIKKEFLGKMPSNSKESNVEGGKSEAITKYGTVGVKVFIYKSKTWQKRNHGNTQKN